MINLGTRISLQAGVAILLACCVLLGAYFLGRLELERERLLALASAQIDAAGDLPASVHFGDSAAQDRLLQGLRGLGPGIRYAALLGPDGTRLRQSPADAERLYRIPALAQLRDVISPLDEGLKRRFDRPPGDSALRGLFGGEPLLDLTVPVTATVNPLRRDLQHNDFAAAPADGTEGTSRYVFAYVLVGIGEYPLLEPALRAAMPAAAGVLGIALATVLLLHRLGRRIGKPMAQLSQIADEIAAGNFTPDQRLEEPGEFRELGSMLSTIIRELTAYRAKLDLDHNLLRRKVEERSTQLSRRNLELNQAVKEVTETRDRLRRMAYFDSLTALPNRRLFMEQLDLLLRSAKRNQQIIALLFIDLDNFKRINDSLGHSAGDRLLQEIARRLVECIRDSDLVSHFADAESGSRIDVSRLGGDEFTVVLNQIERAESAAVVARRLIDTLVEPIRIEGHEIMVTTSIGIAVAPRDAADVDDLLKAADTAMYQAKTQGKNHYLFYHSDMLKAGIDKLRLEGDLRKAIERSELTLLYQPQVDCTNGDVVGVEALLRWQHPERGFVSPGEFIPLAEELGLIGELGHWTLREACRQLVELDLEGVDLPRVSVNVSALQFNRSLIEQVSNVLEETGLSPSRLVLELTEGIAMDDTRDVIRGLEDLKRLQVKLSIDDFGTGYSSLSYLSRFPLDELKIDRNFVIDLSRSATGPGLVSAIIAMAQSLGLCLVAEGVEKREQFDFLQARGVPVIQGYLFSKPLPAAELRRMLTPGYFMPLVSDLRGQGLRALR